MKKNLSATDENGCFVVEEVIDGLAILSAKKDGYGDSKITDLKNT